MHATEIRKLLDATGLRLAVLAGDAQLTHDTLRAWRCGKQTPAPRNLYALAAAIRERASHLTEIADQLTQVAAEEGPLTVEYRRLTAVEREQRRSAVASAFASTSTRAVAGPS